jgi:hypothetical protein
MNTTKLHIPVNPIPLKNRKKKKKKIRKIKKYSEKGLIYIYNFYKAKISLIKNKSENKKTKNKK